MNTKMVTKSIEMGATATKTIVNLGIGFGMATLGMMIKDANNVRIDNAAKSAIKAITKII